MKPYTWLLLLLLGLNMPALGSEEPGYNSEPPRQNGNDLTAGETLFYIAVIEGVVATNAWLASDSPQTYGVAAALLFPLGAINAANDRQFWTSILMAESIAFYNLSLDEDELSDDDVFRNNMIAWHLIMAGLVVTEWIATDKAPSLLMQPLSDGAKLTYEFRF